MSGNKAQLAVLERLRALELEQARVERNALDLAVARKRERLEATQVEIARAQGVLRDRVASVAGMSAEALRQNTDYLGWQGQIGAEQEAALTCARQLAEEARLDVLKKHGQLHAIGRLRERRRREAAVEIGRVVQGTLDEQGLLRAWSRT